MRTTNHELRFTYHAARSAQRGFTLVELLASIAIISIVTGMLVLIMYQFLVIPRRGNAQLAVDSDLRNAGLWLVQDGSQGVSFTGSGTCGVFAVPTAAGATRTITYTLNANTLSRQEGSQIIGVARHVNGVQCPSGSVTGTIAFSLTASSASVSNSAVFTVTLRVNQ